jgi:hypothetical protein
MAGGGLRMIVIFSYSCLLVTYVTHRPEGFSLHKLDSLKPSERSAEVELELDQWLEKGTLFSMKILCAMKQSL